MHALPARAARYFRDVDSWIKATPRLLIFTKWTVCCQPDRSDVDGCTCNACRLQTDAPAEKEEIDFRSYYDPLHDTLKKKIAAADRPVGASDPHRCPPTPGTASWLEARAGLVCTAHRRCGGKDALQVTNSSIGRRRRRQSFDRPWFLMDYYAIRALPPAYLERRMLPLVRNIF